MEAPPGRSTPNPPVGLALRALALAEAVVLLAAGAGLFFFSAEAGRLWPWALTPFNARWLGAVYLASFAAVGLLVYYGRWRPARLVLPMVFVFTAIVLLASLLHFRRFEYARWTTWAWYALYGLLPAASAWYLWQLRDWRPPAEHATPAGWRSVLLLNALLLSLYGSGMFLLPEPLTAFWPWPVDAFHGRLYSAVFTTLAIASLGLTQFAAPVERLTLGAACSVLGLFAVFGVIIADAGSNRVAWSHPGAYLWVSILAAQFVLGLGLIWWSSSPREAGP